MRNSGIGLDGVAEVRKRRHGGNVVHNAGIDDSGIPPTRHDSVVP
jgi:hypothetical protein